MRVLKQAALRATRRTFRIGSQDYVIIFSAFYQWKTIRYCINIDININVNRHKARQERHGYQIRARLDVECSAPATPLCYLFVSAKHQHN